MTHENCHSYPFKGKERFYHQLKNIYQNDLQHPTKKDKVKEMGKLIVFNEKKAWDYALPELKHRVDERYVYKIKQTYLEDYYFCLDCR